MLEKDLGHGPLYSMAFAPDGKHVADTWYTFASHGKTVMDDRVRIDRNTSR